MVIATDPDFDPGNIAMKLHLTYDGLLMSTGNTSRPPHVHTLRRAFHKQLKHFWNTNPFMKNLAEVHPSTHPRVENIAHKYRINGYRFAPLVERKHALLCAIDILYLWPSHPGGLLKHGDIDGRLAAVRRAFNPQARADQGSAGR